MTRKEAVEFLANTKVYVNGKSKGIQKKLFSLGYEWSDGDTNVCYTKSPFLYISSSMTFTMGNDMEHFSERILREISAEEILSLELTETTYRPFKDVKECWKEMNKHHPFGWVKSKDKGYFHLIGLVQFSSELEDVMITFATSEQLARSSRSIYENYIFC